MDMNSDDASGPTHEVLKHRAHHDASARHGDVVVNYRFVWQVSFWYRVEFGVSSRILVVTVLLYWLVMCLLALHSVQHSLDLVLSELGKCWSCCLRMFSL